MGEGREEGKILGQSVNKHVERKVGLVRQWLSISQVMATRGSLK